jgi:hypothetical protein
MLLPTLGAPVHALVACGLRKTILRVSLPALEQPRVGLAFAACSPPGRLQKKVSAGLRRHRAAAGGRQAAHEGGGDADCGASRVPHRLVAEQRRKTRFWGGWLKGGRPPRRRTAWWPLPLTWVGWPRSLALEHAVVAVWRPAAALLRQGLLVNYRAPNGLDCRWLQLVWRPGLVSGGTLAVWLPPNTPNPSRQRLQELLAVWCSAVPLEGRAAPKFLFARH